jgi:hypothetical protein
MPIKVFCPDCDFSIKAPMSAAGTKVDCPECGALVRVPRAATSKSRPSDDRDDRPDPPRRRRDDEDDRPRKSKKKAAKKKARPNKALLIGLIAGGGVFLLILLVVGGIVVYQMTRPKPDKEIAGEGWFKADDPDGLFTAYFPGDKPKYEKVGFQPSEFLAKKAGRDAGELGFSSQNWTRRHEGREYSISLLTLPGSAAGDAAEQAAARARTPPGPGVTVAADDQVTVGARQARRLVTRAGNKGQASMFMGVGGRQALVIVVAGDTSVDHNDPKVKAFFDNFTFLK